MEIAREISMTLDQFYELTFRQIHGLLKTIGVARHEAFRMQAALHGVKIAPKTTLDSPFSKSEDQEFEAVAKEFIKKRTQKNG